MDASQLLGTDFKFVFDFFQAAENEARDTERFILLAVGAIYSYLTTQAIPERFKRIAWYSPPMMVLFAAVRALGLALRQEQLLNYLKIFERTNLGQDQGWAIWYSNQPSVLLWTMGFFYLLLFVITATIAVLMVKTSAESLPQK